MTRLVLLLAVGILISNQNLVAAYLTNVPQTVVQPDGTILNCFSTGDEFHHWMHDSKNFTIIQDPATGYYVYARKSGSKIVPTSFIAGKSDPTALGLEPGVNLEIEEVMQMRREMFKVPALKGASGFNTTGSINNIVIFIRFNDQAESTEPVSKYSSAFNATGTSSMMQYFKEVSGSQLTITTGFYPKTTGSTVVSYKDTRNRSYYCKYNSVSNPTGYQNDTERSNREMTLLKETTEAVKSQIEATGLNYDADGNGQVDNICYIIQGATDAWADLLWPHMWALYAYNVTIGNAQVWNYNFQISSVFGVHVLCHEMSHSLGFPDLYRYSNRTINPVSSWDIMASTTNPPQHPSVYQKLKYGNWITSIPTITANGTYSLKPLASDPFAGYKIASPNSTSEYFVVEYRKTTGLFESQLLGSGLIVYRVNPSLNGNSFGPPDEVYVCRPNGTTTVDGNLAQAFMSSESGRTTYGGTSTTACFLSDGTDGGFKITNIGSAGTTISFTVDFGTSAPPVLALSPITRDVAASAGNTTFAVSNTGAGTMTWTAAVTQGATWAHITSGTSGTNAGSIAVAYDTNTDVTSRTATITITSAGANGSPTTVTIVQAGNPSLLNVGPVTQSINCTSTNLAFAVTNNGGGSMNWTANVTAGSTWAHITEGTSGTNAGTIRVAVDANPDNVIREASISVINTLDPTNSQSIRIIQEANKPVLFINRTIQNIESTGGNIYFNVSNSGGGSLNWSATVTSGNTWAKLISESNSGSAGTLTVVSILYGTNSGSIMVSVDQNPGNIARTSVITVVDANDATNTKTLTITQAANPLILSIYPESHNLPAESSSASFTVGNTGGGNMEWTAEVTEGSDWAHITSGTSGSNSGSIVVSADANPNSTTRTAIITVTPAGASSSSKNLLIIQAANEAVLNVTPDTYALSSDSGEQTFTVSNLGGGTMSWSASITYGSDWAHILSSTDGTNSGSILVAFDANQDNAPRTATLTVTASGTTGSPKSIAIVQEARKPVISVNPTVQTVDYLSTNTEFTVTNLGGGVLNWTAEVTTGSDWIHIMDGSAGINDGTISVNIDTNPDNTVRQATITVISANDSENPQTLTIVQTENKPVLYIDRTSQKIQTEGGRVVFNVMNTGGGSMGWTATLPTDITWARIIDGSAGMNRGAVTVQIDANNGDLRIAEVTVTADGGASGQMSLNIFQKEKEAELIVGPAAQSVDSDGGFAAFNVNKTGFGTIEWQAEVTEGSSWLQITAGTNGTDDGLINVKADANTGAPRSATITVTALNSSASPKTLTIMQDISSGITTLSNQTSFNVYPNPVDRQCTVKIEGFDGNTQKLEIFNMMGQLENHQDITRESTVIDLSELPQGIYLFRVTSEGQILSQRRVVKN